MARLAGALGAIKVMSKSMLARLSVQTEGRTREELVGTIMRLSLVAEEQKREISRLEQIEKTLVEIARYAKAIQSEGDASDDELSVARDIRALLDSAESVKVEAVAGEVPRFREHEHEWSQPSFGQVTCNKCGVVEPV